MASDAILTTEGRVAMSYLSKTVHGSFEEALTRVRDELKKEGFAVLTEIDVRENFRKWLFRDFQNYEILCCFIPRVAYQALHSDDRAGLMLPCNIIVQQPDSDRVEVWAFDPLEWTKATNDPGVHEVAGELRRRLQNAIDRL